MFFFSSESEAILKDFWEKGMRKGTQELIRDAAIQTQGTTSDVKVNLLIYKYTGASPTIKIY